MSTVITSTDLWDLAILEQEDGMFNAHLDGPGGECFEIYMDRAELAWLKNALDEALLHEVTV
jgi:hypothetical protein